MTRWRLHCSTPMLIALLAGLPAASSAVASGALWQLPDGQPCEIELQTIAPLTLELGSLRGSIRGDGTRWAVTTQRDQATLRIAAVLRGASNPPQEPPLPSELSPLHLELPEGCAVAVRGAEAPVEVRGPITAPLSVETSTGDVTVWIAGDSEPRGGDLAIELATSGPITVDWSIELRYLHQQQPSKRGRMRFGAAATAVTVTSRQGGLAVLQTPRSSPFI